MDARTPNTTPEASSPPDWDYILDWPRRALAEVARLEALEAGPVRVSLDDIGPHDILPSLSEAQAVLRSTAADVVARHQAWQDERKPPPGLTASGKRPARKSVPAPPPTLVEVGVGVGKSSVAIPLMAKQVPTLIVAHTLELARDLDAKIQATKTTTTRVHLGRHQPDPEAGETTSSDYVCAHEHDIAKPLGENRHAVMTHGCIGCAEGGAAVVSIALSAGRLDNAAEAQDRLHSVCRARGIDPASVQPCGTILAVSDEPSIRTLIMCAQAYTPASASYDDGSQQDRLVVVDEAAELLSTFDVGIEDIAKWRQAIEYAANKKDTPTANGRAIQSAIILREISEAFADVAGAAATASPGTWWASPALAEALAEAVRLATPLIESKSIPTAPWEMPGAETGNGQHQIPLRAIADLGFSLEHGTLQVVGGRLIGMAPTPLLRAIVARTVHAVILDATPNPTVRAIVAALGGQVVRAVPEQPLPIEWHPARVHGRYALLADDRRMAAEVAGVNSVVERKARERGRAPAVLGHRPVVQKLACDEEGRGYWGRDERGHDRWAGRDVLIDGFNIRSEDGLRACWLGHRGLLEWAGAGEGVSEWSPERIANVEVEIVDGEWAPSPLQLPADPQIRVYELQVRGGECIQGFGRSRALHHKGLEGTAMGPPAPIGQGGYRQVTVDLEDPVGMAQTRAIYDEARHLAPLLRITAGAVRIMEQGGKPSRRKIVDLLVREVGTLGIGAHLYSLWFERWGGLGVDDLRVVLAELRARAGELVERGAKVVGLELLERHNTEHGDDCFCTFRAVGELLATAGDVVPVSVGLRGPP